MKGLHFVLLFTAMTFISWGTYGPVLRHGTHALEKDSLRAFVGVGLAYFLIAVIIPLLMLNKSKENGSWTFSGVIYSLVAGSVGALGALGIILALGYGGETVYVMPIVFGFAPVVNTLVTSFLGKTFNQIRPVFIGGIVTAALGAVGVLVFHSQGAPKPAKEPDVKPAVWNMELNRVEQEGTPAISPQAPAPQPQEPAPQPQEPAPSSNPPAPQQDSPAVDPKPEPKPEPKPDETKPAESKPAEVKPAEDKADEKKPSESKPEDAKPANKPAEDKPTDQPATNPAPQEPAKTEPPKVDPPSVDGSKKDDSKQDDTKQQDKSKSDAEAKETSPAKPSSSGEKDSMAIALSIIMAAICWGSYGPMLHIGQTKMSGSRLRPFMCVGIAYFLIAVFVPLVLIFNRSVDNGSWTPVGMTWAFFAGVAGALGALGVILAFNAGGKPIYVMPLVFGFAPVINTSITLSEKNAWGEVHPMFWVSLAVVIAGAVTVLITAPKPKPKPAS